MSYDIFISEFSKFDKIPNNELVSFAIEYTNKIINEFPTLSLTEEQINELELILDKFFTYYSNVFPFIQVGSSQVFDLASVSASCYKVLDEKRQTPNYSFIAYPPEYVFPRNPNLAQFLDPQIIEDEIYKDDGSGLKFEFGFAGGLNVIRTKYPPFLDKKFYNFSANRWLEEQIIITINGNDNVEDVTPYFLNSVVNFSGNATGINDKISYYFDGEKIVTNFDFSNVDNRKKVHIKYKKILNSLRVKAVFKNNVPGLSFQTPVVDQYTLLVDKQRVLN
jgi:hypothetical protein